MRARGKAELQTNARDESCNLDSTGISKVSALSDVCGKYDRNIAVGNFHIYPSKFNA
jgi:hypothetical protein